MHIPSTHAAPGNALDKRACHGRRQEVLARADHTQVFHVDVLCKSSGLLAREASYSSLGREKRKASYESALA